MKTKSLVMLGSFLVLTTLIVVVVYMRITLTLMRVRAAVELELMVGVLSMAHTVC